MQLPKKLKLIAEILFPFLKSPTNFEHSEIKDDIHRQCIYEFIDCQVNG